ncbi:DUF4394 domain-containing protein [Hymenobacter busanensis]|uniref:DUF4394 domain-containing protein n=1 Tax=Hymenobacter busanensis TaxID=2607656 RepID=A0A7L4ZTC7_9BACT|nr:DUF4394 domain-containing protein [Hymenobacter busanensis]KAA9327625.1 DUF4394 domain-containing protein [Hymenobacter busanensis]QHJ06036.1 DUF4394 domain-containing protein [Hymenobacter busanensis]
MSTVVPTFFTSGFWRRTCGVLALGVLGLAAAPAAQAQVVYGLSGTDLTSVNLASPLTSQTRQPITGILPGQTLVGLDFRPATGELYALGYNAAPADTAANTANLYVITQNTATPVATATVVGSGSKLRLGSATDRIGFDFNPTVDRIRVVSTNDNNYRLNPNDGAIVDSNPSVGGVQRDGNLAYAAGDPNAGQNPFVGAAAYTNSFIGAASTTLYYIDEQRSLLLRSDAPNAGTLATVALLTPSAGGNPTPINAPGASTDLDIFTFGPGDQQAYLNVNQVSGGSFISLLYRVNLADGTTTFAGAVNGSGVGITDIAVRINRTAPAANGQLLYAVSTNNNLLSFYSGTPNFINSAVPITGIAAGQTLVGTDFRPATGQLYGFGYDATTTGNNAQLYVINPATGAATSVAAAIRLELGGLTANIGFDFNPTVDLIRVVSTNRRNYRLNPTTGALAFTDGLLTYAAGDTTTPRIGSVAYTNSFAGSTTTTLYDIDELRSILAIQAPPNNGTLTPVGSITGLSLNNTPALVDLDIYSVAGSSTNTAFLVANPNGFTTSNLYTLDLTTGNPSLMGPIGLGIPVRDVSAFIAPVVTGFTWTGAVSTDWGTAGNWSTNQVPTATDDVTIPNVANDPVVSNAQQARSVTLGSGATLTTTNGGTLTVNGTFTNNGGTTLGSGSGTVAFNGPAAQTISGTTTFFQNLTAGPAGVTAAAPVQVQRVLLLNGNLASNGNLTLLSNATGTAHVINAAGAVTGNATVQRSINNATAPVGYRHYSSPVLNTTVADLATPGYTPVVNPDYNSQGNTVTPFPTVFGYDQSRVTTSGSPRPVDFDKGFFSPASLADPLVPGRGYTVNIPASETVDFVGVPNNGSVVQGALARGSQTESGWHLLGNPYPSPLNWDFVGRSNIDAAVYVYQPTGQYAGTYRSYVANSDTTGQRGLLAVAQGFFVRVSTPNSNNGQVSFTNAARPGFYANPSFSRGAGTSPLVRLNLRSASGLLDETMVYFDPQATAGFDSEYDAYKLQGGSSLLLATEALGNLQLSVNGLPALGTTDAEVNLVVQAPVGANTLEVANLLRLPAGTHAYLRDAQTSALIDLAAQPSYSFTRVAGAPATGRFSLLITSRQVLATAPAALAQQVAVYPNPARNLVSVALPAALRGQAVALTLVNTLGQVVTQRTVPATRPTDTATVPLTGVAAGVYTLRLQTGQGVVNKRLVIE